MTDRVRMPNLARSPLNRGVPQCVDASKVGTGSAPAEV